MISLILCEKVCVSCPQLTVLFLGRVSNILVGVGAVPRHRLLSLRVHSVGWRGRGFLHPVSSSGVVRDPTPHGGGLARRLGTSRAALVGAVTERMASEAPGAGLARSGTVSRGKAIETLPSEIHTSTGRRVCRRLNFRARRLCTCCQPCSSGLAGNGAWRRRVFRRILQGACSATAAAEEMAAFVATAAAEEAAGSSSSLPRSASRKEGLVGEPPAGEAGLESIHLCSLFRPLGENGAANGDREEGDAGVVWSGEATGAAVRVAAEPGVGTGVGLVDG
jgi:hypothetical protein